MRKIILWMPDSGEAGYIRARFQGDSAWTEFRGAPYSKWGEGRGGRFEALHNALEGRHASVLHADDILVLHPEHSDYEVVKKMLDEYS
jgi:hypothetical protein